MKLPSSIRRAGVRLAAALALCSLVSSLQAASGGWADDAGGVTGGAAGPTVTVSTPEDLINYAQTQTGPYVIRVSGNIRLTATLGVNSNKTIEGIDANSTIDGEIMVGTGKSNVIIRSLTITNDRTVGTGDGVRIYGSHHVWVDRCTFVDCDDGMIDNSNASDYVTISWCKFYYTRDNGHNFVNLIGAADTDSGNYRITFHHNWWSTLCRQRMPADRFGQVHMYNNYFSCSGNSYCSNARLSTQILSENNYYDGVDDPLYSDSANARIKATGNLYVNCTGLISPGTDTVFNPPYAYTLDATANVPAIVMAGAGNGNGGPQPTIPNAPTSLTATAGKRKVTLGWTDNANNEDGFRVERSNDGVNFAEIASVGANVNSYANTGLTTGVTYYYRVRAYNSIGTSAYTNVSSATAK